MAVERNRNAEYTREREPARFRFGTQLRWSEEEWERWFIRRLREIGWDYCRDLKNEENQTNEKELRNNLLRQIRRLYIQKNNLSNNFEFTRAEEIQILRALSSFKSRDISKPIELRISSEGVVGRLEIPLIDTENIKNNTFQVAQQVKEYKKGFIHIYDLVLLINGIPLVCIELKKATISVNEALRQLRNYERERLETECLSIFNNFQLFIALNFQRFYCMKREEIVKANIEDLKIRGKKYVYLMWLERQIEDYFSPSWIFKKILQKEPAYNQTYCARKVLVRESNGNYRSGAETTSWTSSENIKKARPPNKNIDKFWIFVCVALLSFFLLINFLSGWAWWTILIGLAVIGFALYEKISRA